MHGHIPYHKVVMVLCASITSEIKVSIMVFCLLCLPCYTAVQIKNYWKSTSVAIYVANMNSADSLHTPVIVWSWSIHFTPLSAMFNSLNSSLNQELFEKHLCNHGKHYETICYAKESIMCNHQIDDFHCQQRWIEHKGGHR